MPPKAQTTSTPITISSLKFITPAQLSTTLLDPSTSASIAVVDVRDSDHIGGHIRTSIHAPSEQLDTRMPELVRTLRDQRRVVFHCMLSQQRGPKAALAYARARARMVEKEGLRSSLSGSETEAEARGEDGGEEESTVVVAGQEVCVLRGGFTDWQKSFGSDKQLTEGYVKELWDAELFSC